MELKIQKNPQQNNDFILDLITDKDIPFFLVKLSVVHSKQQKKFIFVSATTL